MEILIGCLILAVLAEREVKDVWAGITGKTTPAQRARAARQKARQAAREAAYKAAGKTPPRYGPFRDMLADRWAEAVADTHARHLERKARRQAKPKRTGAARFAAMAWWEANAVRHWDAAWDKIAARQLAKLSGESIDTAKPGSKPEAEQTQSDDFLTDEARAELWHGLHCPECGRIPTVSEVEETLAAPDEFPMDCKGAKSGQEHFTHAVRECGPHCTHGSIGARGRKPVPTPPGVDPYTQHRHDMERLEKEAVVELAKNTHIAAVIPLRREPEDHPVIDAEVIDDKDPAATPAAAYTTTNMKGTTAMPMTEATSYSVALQSAQSTAGDLTDFAAGAEAFMAGLAERGVSGQAMADVQAAFEATTTAAAAWEKAHASLASHQGLAEAVQTTDGAAKDTDFYRE